MTSSTDAVLRSLDPTMNRRRFLSGAVAAALLLSRPASAALHRRSAERSLRFLNTHTGEQLCVVYWAHGRYVANGLAAVNHVLRDHRTDEVKAIDPQLLDMLHGLSGALGTREPFEIISGYRSPATNAMLAAHSGGVSVHSLHLEGKAVDIRVCDRPLADLRAAAMSLRAGGVGYYPAAEFVHVDIGRVRYW